MYLGVHDPGDVAGGFVFGVACLAAYIAIEQHPKSSARLGALSGLQMLGDAAYPAFCLCDDLSCACRSRGTFLVYGCNERLADRTLCARGHEEVAMPNMFVWRVLTATLLTGISFVLLTVLSRLPGYLAEDDPLLHYGCGVLFGTAITGLLPLLLVQAGSYLTKKRLNRFKNGR